MTDNDEDAFFSGRDDNVATSEPDAGHRRTPSLKHMESSSVNQRAQNVFVSEIMTASMTDLFCSSCLVSHAFIPL